MAQFSVGRSTVREALRVLQANGLVRSRPGDPRGAEILSFSPAALHKSMTTLARAEELSLGELVQFRMLLDGASCRLAASLRTSAELAEMEAAIADMRAALDQGHDRFSAADVAFHDVVARASRNKLLQVCGEAVGSVVQHLITDKIAQAGDRAALMRDSIAHHVEVLAAVRERNGVRAARLAREKLYDYYAEYVALEERPALRALIE